MSKPKHVVIFENTGIKIVEKPSKEMEEKMEYHMYALDLDDFGNESWRWIGKSGINSHGERYAQRSRS